MAKKAKGSKSVVQTIVLMLLLAAVVLGAYFMITRSDTDAPEADVVQTEYEQIMSRDMEKDYPYTVRELANYYCRIMKCMLNDEMTDSEFEDLVDRMRLLFDSELLDINPRDLHIQTMRAERNSYINGNIKVSSYTIDTFENVKEKDTSDGKMASLSLYFSTMEGDTLKRSYHDFVFRQDDGGYWRILGWQLSNG